MRQARQPARVDSKSQPDLFGEPAAPAYVPDPRHVRNRLVGMIAAMRAAETWPWNDSAVRLYRERVWPYLCDLLPDAGEAERWRKELAAEAARLDAAGSPPELR